jgi:hypothetical protein
MKTNSFGAPGNSTEELIRAFKQGNQFAFEMLCGRFTERVDIIFLRCGMRFVEDREDLEIVLWTVVSYKIRTGQYEETGHFQQYVQALAWRMAVNWQEKTLNNKLNVADYKYDYKAEHLSKDLGLPFNISEKKLMKFMQRLPEREQVILYERFYQDKKYVIIAAEHHWPLGTVTSAATRALEKIKKWLEEEL